MAHFKWEKQILKSNSNSCIAGVDEAGRGAWAGPVVVAMVILNPREISPDINDSKKISSGKREFLAEKIKTSAIGYSISIVSEKIVDDINVLQATLLGAQRCFDCIAPKPNHLLLDALELTQLKVAQTKLIKGDEVSYSIAAASILAKTTRDKIMVNLARKYPGYGFERHKGYGVDYHRKALHEIGHCPIHRKSFRPILELEKGFFD